MTGLPEDWWPDFIPPLDDGTFRHGDHVTVAEMIEPEGRGTYRQVFTALATKPVADKLLARTGEIGVEVNSSGPHPSVDEDAGPAGYEPRFWIFGGPVAPDGLEPLVVAWRSANTTVLRLDQGFLMTYALVPRVIRDRDGQIDEHWDDNETPKADIVVSRPRSAYDFPRLSPGWVRVRREYLEDYAFLRDRCLLHVVYGQADGIVRGEILDALRKTKSAKLQSAGREVGVHLSDSADHVHVRYWIVRLLLEPRIAPISAGRWDYSQLRWPGIPTPLTHRTRMVLPRF